MCIDKAAFAVLLCFVAIFGPIIYFGITNSDFWIEYKKFRQYENDKELAKKIQRALKHLNYYDTNRDLAPKIRNSMDDLKYEIIHEIKCQVDISKIKTDTKA